MFVIINSTPTRINKSHLVDLYERVSWAAPDRKFAARVVEQLYVEGDSPLRYRINRLGGRSKQEKWILQAELFNEIHRWVQARLAQDRRSRARSAKAEPRYYEIVRDFLKAAETASGATPGASDSYMVTKPVTLKAMLRVCADLAREDAEPADGRVERWEERLAPWAEHGPRSSATRGSTSASRPRARSSASRGPSRAREGRGHRGRQEGLEPA